MKVTITNIQSKEVQRGINELDQLIDLVIRHNGEVVSRETADVETVVVAKFDKEDANGFDVAASDLGHTLEWDTKKGELKMATKQEKTTYYLVVEYFDRFNTKFSLVEIEALSIKDAITQHLEFESNYDFADELTIEGQSGRYVGDEHTIGIATSKDTAALQYVKSRMEHD